MATHKKSSTRTSPPARSKGGAVKAQQFFGVGSRTHAVATHAAKPHPAPAPTTSARGQVPSLPPRASAPAPVRSPMLAAMRAIGGDSRLIPIAEIRLRPLQQRRYNAYAPDVRAAYDRGIVDFSKTIARDGLLNAVTLRELPSSDLPHRYELLAGERRYRAHVHLKLLEIPARVVSAPDDATLHLVQFVENFERVDLSPMELVDSIALVCQALSARAGGTEPIAFEVLPEHVPGITRTFAITARRVYGLPSAAKEMLYGRPKPSLHTIRRAVEGLRTDAEKVDAVAALVARTATGRGRAQSTSLDTARAARKRGIRQRRVSRVSTVPRDDGGFFAADILIALPRAQWTGAPDALRATEADALDALAERCRERAAEIRAVST